MVAKVTVAAVVPTVALNPGDWMNFRIRVGRRTFELARDGVRFAQSVHLTRLNLAWLSEADRDRLRQVVRVAYDSFKRIGLCMEPAQ